MPIELDFTQEKVNRRLKLYPCPKCGRTGFRKVIKSVTGAVSHYYAHKKELIDGFRGTWETTEFCAVQVKKARAEGEGNGSGV